MIIQITPKPLEKIWTFKFAAKTFLKRSNCKFEAQLWSEESSFKSEGAWNENSLDEKVSSFVLGSWLTSCAASTIISTNLPLKTQNSSKWNRWTFEDKKCCKTTFSFIFDEFCQFPLFWLAFFFLVIKPFPKCFHLVFWVVPQCSYFHFLLSNSRIFATKKTELSYFKQK